MSSWSRHRKLSYALVVLILAIGCIAVPIFFVVYKAPTCTDGVKNGNELGIDCGGSCQKLCQSAFFAPNVAWTRFEKVSPGLYNVATYIINPNTNAEAVAVPYQVSLYDNKGILITEVNGAVSLPPRRNTLAFNGAVSVGSRIPAKALFEFVSSPEWTVKADPLGSLQVVDKNYTEDETGSSLTATLKNTAVVPLDNVTVSAVLYDKDANALGFSRTIVDEIPAQGTALAPFTWPVSRNGGVVTIEILPVKE